MVNKYLSQIKDIMRKSSEFEDRVDGENYILDALKECSDNNDYEFLMSLGKAVIDGDESIRKYSPILRMQTLSLLLDDTVKNIQNCHEDDEEEIYYYNSNLFDLLWYFKWILPDLPEVLRLEKDMILAANDMMNHYYRNMNFELGMYYKTLMLQNMVMGDVESAKENYNFWKNSDSDDYMNDCEACEVTEEVNYYTFIGEYEKALELAKPILKGRLSCAEVPHITYGHALKSMYMLGKVEDVKKYLPRATSLIRRDKNLVWVIPSLIESAVKIGDLDYAKKLAEEFESRIYERTEELTLLKYFIATSAFIEEHYDRALTGAAYFDARN